MGILTNFFYSKIYKLINLKFFQNDKLDKIKKEELEYLETQSVPLRNYLMTHVMPTLTKGLIECCKQKPEDPIDYLVTNLPSNTFFFQYFLSKFSI